MKAKTATMAPERKRRLRALDTCHCAAYDDGRTIGVLPCASHAAHYAGTFAPAPADAAYRAAMAAAVRALATAAREEN